LFDKLVVVITVSNCECLQAKSSATKIEDCKCPKPQFKSFVSHKPTMKHKSESKLRVCCQTPSTFTGPWIPPPGRTTRRTRYGWQVYIRFGSSQLLTVVFYRVGQKRATLLLSISLPIID